MTSSRQAARESGEQQSPSDQSYYTGYATTIDSRNDGQDLESVRFSRDVKTTRPFRAVSLAAIVVISGLLLSGCRTASLISLHIFSVSYDSQYNTDSTGNTTLSDIFSLAMNDSSASRLQEVRVGYLGVCVRTDPMPWSCASNGPGLAGNLRDANIADPLDLIAYAEKFRNEAVTVIYLYIILVCSSLALAIELFFPHSRPAIERLKRGAPTESNGLWQSASFLRPFTHSATCFFSLNSAVWLHLASASAVSMTSTLSFGAVTAQSGSSSIALAWLSFGLAGAMIVTDYVKRRNKKYYYFKAKLNDAEPRLDGAGNPGEDGNANVGNEGGENIEMAGQEAGHHHAQAYNDFIQTLQFLFGQDDFVVKQRHTANWVQRDTMDQGYAETIHEEGQG